MSKTVKFAVTTLWILLSRSYDVFATYQHTPDLQHEANPLASVFHLGWSPILLVVGLLTLAIIYFYYVATFKKYQLTPEQKGYNLRQFITHIYLGKADKWSAMLYKFPSSKRMIHYFGPQLAKSMAFAGIISTTMWLLINYTEFYKHYHTAGMVYAILFVGIAAIIIHWHWQLYRRYRQSMAN